MSDAPRERLLASYADIGEAMVIQNVLEAEGIPCRVADLANVPAHMFGIAGALGRSVGLWVLDGDVERAGALLATLGASEGGVDEEALAAEAIAAPSRDDPGEERRGPRARPSPPAVGAAPRWLGRAILVSLLALAVLLASRGCR